MTFGVRLRCRRGQADQQGRRVTRSRLSRLLPFSIIIVTVTLLVPTAQAADLGETREHLTHGRYRECIDAAAAAIADQTFIDEWYRLKARAHAAIGEDNEAIETLEAGALRFSLSIKLRLLLYEAYHRVDRIEDAKLTLERINRMILNAPWRYSDSDDLVTQGRVALVMGADPRQVLELLYDRALRQDANNREAFLASGQLALDKEDYAEAARAFQNGLKKHEDDPELLFGYAQAMASTDGKATEAALAKTLEINPNHVGALLMQADHLIDSEREAEAGTVLDQVLAVNTREPRAWAYKAVLAHLESDAIGEHECRNLALARWSTNPLVDHLIGRKLSQNYRFAEGAAYQRQALTMDADYLPAQKQLSQDLLRLGDVDQGWAMVTAVHETDGYDVVAFNLTTLRDRMAEFRTLRDDDFILRMSAHEADIYGAEVMALLHRAKTALCDKYGLELKEPVTVEVFPDQRDFAIRTFGLPVGPGYLGVCFGKVVTANSPAAQGATPSNWQAILWHEFCHVVTLTITNNKMPRWLSEGISVYEEKQANGTWGQSMNIDYRQMILDGELTPISRLSGAFLRPKSAQHLSFAYYESSLVIEYMINTFGLDKVKAVLRDLGRGVDINRAIETHMGSLTELDAAFEKFVRERADQLAPDADWTKDEFTREVQRDPEALKRWIDEHPNHYPALRFYANWLMQQNRFEDATEMLKRAIALYPTETGPGSAYLAIARIYRQRELKSLERAALEKLASMDADATDAFLRLMELAAAESDWATVRDQAQRMLAVNPLVPQPHRYLAMAAEALHDDDTAITEYSTLVRMDTTDPALAHFKLATLLHARGDAAAKRHVLKALEEAPRYRDAHKLLLAIIAEEPRPNTNDIPPTVPPATPAPPSDTSPARNR